MGGTVTDADYVGPYGFRATPPNRLRPPVCPRCLMEPEEQAREQKICNNPQHVHACGPGACVVDGWGWDIKHDHLPNYPIYPWADTEREG